MPTTPTPEIPNTPAPPEIPTTPPPAELAPSCGAASVLGVRPGFMGMLQALEVFKLVTGAGQPLTSRRATPRIFFGACSARPR